MQVTRTTPKLQIDDGTALIMETQFKQGTSLTSHLQT